MTRYPTGHVRPRQLGSADSVYHAHPLPVRPSPWREALLTIAEGLAFVLLFVAVIAAMSIDW